MTHVSEITIPGSWLLLSDSKQLAQESTKKLEHKVSESFHKRSETMHHESLKFKINNLNDHSG